MCCNNMLCYIDMSHYEWAVCGYEGFIGVGFIVVCRSSSVCNQIKVHTRGFSHGYVLCKQIFQTLKGKTELSIVEIHDKIQNVEEAQCQRMSEARVSQADIATKSLEHKQGAEYSLSMFRIELIEIVEGMTAENLTLFKTLRSPN